MGAGISTGMNMPQNSFDKINAARQAGFQVGPTPNQPPNPFAGMSIGQLQAMNAQIDRSAQEAQMNERMRQQNMMQTQPVQGRGKGGGGRSAFNQQLMQLPGMAESLQASQQRMAQDPNANMMRAQPALPAGYDPNVHQRGFGVMMDNPLQVQQPLARSTNSGLASDNMRQMPVGGFGRPDQASIQAQIDDLARRRADPATMQMQMVADALQGRRQAPPNITPVQLQQMNNMVREQQMMRQQMMPQQQLAFNQSTMRNPMSGGLGALAPMGRYNAPPGQPMRSSGGKGGVGVNQQQTGNPFRANMARGIGSFFR